MSLEIQPIEPLGTIRGLKAVLNGQEVGYLNYEVDPNQIYFADIMVRRNQQGIGQALLKRFTQLVGHDATITGDVTHVGTLLYLNSIGIFREATSEPVDIVDHKILQTIPGVRFLRRFGISTQRLSVSLNELSELGFADRFNVKFLGKVDSRTH